MKREDLSDLVRRALEEDVGRGDATTEACVSSSARMRGRIEAREAGIFCGRLVAEEVFLQLDPECEFSGLADGDRLVPGAILLELRGSAAALLTGERTALNFLQRLCGIATLTRRFVDEVSHTRARVLDTRKTTPLLRQLEKYAVRCGGGTNHRMALDDMLLIKENHIQAAGSIQAALRGSRQSAQGRPVAVEVQNLHEFSEALRLQPDRILLDHWKPEDIQEAVRRRGSSSAPEIEVSGNLTLANIAAFALPGVQFLSVGALTHSASSLDLSMLLENDSSGT